MQNFQFIEWMNEWILAEALPVRYMCGARELYFVHMGI